MGKFNKNKNNTIIVKNNKKKTTHYCLSYFFVQGWNRVRKCCRTK